MTDKPLTVPQLKYRFIMDAIALGCTVFLQTATKTIKITPETYRRWDQGGHTLLEVRGKSLYVAQGKKMVCADYCQVTTQAPAGK